MLAVKQDALAKSFCNYSATLGITSLFIWLSNSTGAMNVHLATASHCVIRDVIPTEWLRLFYVCI